MEWGCTFGRVVGVGLLRKVRILSSGHPDGDISRQKQLLLSKRKKAVLNEGGSNDLWLQREIGVNSYRTL